MATTHLTTAGEALLATTERMATLLRAVPDPTLIARPTTWTIAETAVHVLSELEDHVAYAENAARPDLPDGPAWQRGRAANAEQLERTPERDLQLLAAQLVPAAERAVSVLSGVDHVWSTNALLWGGEQTLQILLGEQLVHGRDIARAAGLDWRIDPADALMVAQGAVEILPDYLRPVGNPERRMSFEIRLRGGPAYRLDIKGDTAVAGPAGGRVDCVISADPVAFLEVGYGRANPLVAALTGKLVAKGRKPWLGLAFGKLFAAP
jgi:uncharacterized protein (TIGR03083 family)